MKKQILKRLNRQGFTLVELLVAMGISAVVMAGIYTVYSSQQKSYTVQEQMAAMQQNLRAAIYFMEREIRMAGHDPTRKVVGGAGIQTAGPNTINFTLDITDNPGTGDADGDTADANENITYSLYTADGIQKLGRKSTSTANNQPVAENIDALDFVYLDANGAPTATLANIRSVQITLVARTGREDPGYTNNEQFYNQNPDGQELIYTALNDSFRRKRLTTEVKCRNIGL